jgi:pimeloyl-ACP methyl ester carboxylesterase
MTRCYRWRSAHEKSAVVIERPVASHQNLITLKPSLSIGLPVMAVMLLAGLAWLWTPDINRATLERKYLKHAADMMEVGGTRLHVRDSGSKNAPAIIMIHGFGASLQTWDAMASALESTHRVIRFDLPGSGLSPPDPRGDYTDARSLALIVALQDKLGLRSSNLIGHSIGGRMAWTFAALHPKRVDKLVLIAPDGFASPGFKYGEAPKVPAVFKLMRFFLPKMLLRSSLEPAYANRAMVTDALITRYHDLALAPGARQALLTRMEQTVLVDPLPLLRRITAPTLLMWGERDAMIPIANAQDYLKAIPNVRLVSFASSGHLPQEEVPAEAADAVREFLDVK